MPTIPDTSVKHIHNGMRGAPQITGTVGSGYIPVLDALFVSGWGLTTALSVTVADGIATATLTSGQTFDRTSVVLVAGATPSELNGEARVLTSSNTSIAWATTAADGVATGTITIKYAPQASWVSPYAKTNVKVYRSTHAQSSGHCLRVDDTGTTSARIRGFESMSDVDTGVGPFPTDAQMSGGGYWWRSINANATPVKYKMFCDERFLISSIAAGFSSAATNLSAFARGFGDPIPLSPSGDAWATLLSVMWSLVGNSSQGSLDSQITPSTTSGLTCAPRAFSGLGTSEILTNRSFIGSSGARSGADPWLGPIPSPVDGQVKTSRIFLGSTPPAPPRCIVPGIHYIPQTGAGGGTLSDGDILDGAGDLSGKKLMVVSLGASYSSTPDGAYLVDITGPWR
jgi:hypothetical protein